MKKILVTLLCICLGLVVLGSGCIESETQTIVIGGKTFNEQFILAHMISLLLEEQGLNTEVKTGLNSLPLYEGMKTDDIDIYVEYTGTAYSEILNLSAPDVWDKDVVYTAVADGVEDDGIVLMFRIGFENAYSVAVEEAWAAENNVETIWDLRAYDQNMTLGSDLVFHDRPDGYLALQDVYGIEFKNVQSMEPTLMYEAIKNDEVDVIPPYTTDARIDSYNLRVLEDNKSALPPYEGILLVRDELAINQTLVDTLSVLENSIDAEKMRELNTKFDVDKEEAETIAREYLIDQGLIEQ